MTRTIYENSQPLGWPQWQELNQQVKLWSIIHPCIFTLPCWLADNHKRHYHMCAVWLALTTPEVITSSS
jgi:hypothetical protein